MSIEIFFFLFLCPCLLCRQLTKKLHHEFMYRMQPIKMQMKTDMNEINIVAGKNLNCYNET